jgi:hypothetical protein
MKIAVIGGGPAGLFTATSSTRSSLRPTSLFWRRLTASVEKSAPTKSPTVRRSRPASPSFTSTWGPGGKYPLLPHRGRPGARVLGLQLIQGRSCWNARAMAAELERSERTVSRDLRARPRRRPRRSAATCTRSGVGGRTVPDPPRSRVSYPWLSTSKKDSVKVATDRSGGSGGD